MSRVCEDFGDGENDHRMREMFEKTAHVISNIENIWKTCQELSEFYISLTACGIDVFLKPVVNLLRLRKISECEYNLHKNEINFMVKFLRDVKYSRLTNEKDYLYLVG